MPIHTCPSYFLCEIYDKRDSSIIYHSVEIIEHTIAKAKRLMGVKYFLKPNQKLRVKELRKLKFAELKFYEKVL